MPVLSSDYSGYHHSTSGAKICKRARRLIGSIDQNEDYDANELVTDLEALNKMIDSWNAESLTLYTVEMFSVSIGGSDRQVDIGPGGDLDMPRPGRLEEGQVFLKTSTTNYRLRPMTQQQWAEIEADTTSTGTPEAFYYDANSPTGEMSFDVTPDTTYTLEVYAPTLLAQIQNAQAALTLPPSYADALDHNLAVRLAPEYSQDVPPSVAQLAVTLKAKIERRNFRMDPVKPDLGLRRGGYDIRSDRFI